MADEIQNIILNVQNADRLRELNVLLKQEKDGLLQIDAALKQQKISQAQADAIMKGYATNIQGINREIKDLEKASKGLTSPQGLLNLSYIFDDLSNTSGSWAQKLSSISNNLPGLVSALGVSGGLVGVLGLAGTATILLASNWQKLMDALGMSDFSDAEKGLDKLKGKADEAIKAFEKLRNARSDDETKGGAALANAMEGDNAEKVMRAIALHLETSGKGEQPNAAEAAGLAGGFRENIVRQLTEQLIGAGVDPATAARMVENSPEVDERVNEAVGKTQLRIKLANQDRAREIMAGVDDAGQAGKNARKMLGNAARALPDRFPAGFLGDLEGAEPEAVKAQRELDARGAANAEAWQRKQKADEAKARAVWGELDDTLDGQIRDGQKADREREQNIRKAARDIEARTKDDEAGEAQEARWARELAAAQAAEARAAAKAAREQPLNDARQAVTDFGNANGYSGDAAAVEGLARNVVGMQRQGLSLNEAILRAFGQYAQQLEEMRSEIYGMQGRVQGYAGGNQGFGFSGLQSFGW